MSRDLVPARSDQPPKDGLAVLESKLLAAYASPPFTAVRDGWSVGFTLSDWEHDAEQRPHQVENYRRRAREWAAVAPPRAELVKRQATLAAAYKGPPDRNVSRALIGLLLDAFPAGRPADFRRYADAILHDVVDLGFSPQILARACQSVRRKSEFLPTCARVLSACEEAKEELRLRLQTANLHVLKAQGAEAVLALPEPEKAA